MSQELQDFVDEAVEASNNEKALWSVQLLLRDWNEAMTVRRAWGGRDEIKESKTTFESTY